MKQVLFYDKGYEKTGKSASIKAVFRELASRVPKENVERLEGSEDAYVKADIRGIIKYRDVRIGIESQGDPNSELAEHVNTFIKKGCEIIVCACRTKGKDFQKVFKATRKAEYIEFAAPHFCVKDLSDDTYLQLNGEYACRVVRWIDWWIDNYKD